MESENPSPPYPNIGNSGELKHTESGAGGEREAKVEGILKFLPVLLTFESCKICKSELYREIKLWTEVSDFQIFVGTVLQKSS